MIQLILADVLTLDSKRPQAEAVLCAGGRIIAVGDRDDMQALSQGFDVETLDRRGYVLTPALTDSHIHLVSYGFSLDKLHLDGFHNVFELQLGLQEFAQRRPEMQWIEGLGFSVTGLGLYEYPHKSWLNEICPDRPVILRSKDLHAVWINSRALALSGIGVDTPDPPGGRIVRDDQGKPTGVLLESAMRLVERVMPVPTEAEYLAAARRGVHQMRAYGYGAVHTLAFEPPEALAALQTLDARGELPLRVWACLPHDQLESARALGLRGGSGGHIRLGGVKFLADGTLGSRTAWLKQGYADGTGTGISLDSPEVMFERGRQALEMGFSMVVHAIGDRANSETLEVFRKLKPLADARKIRLRLEHAQHLDPTDLLKIAQLGIAVSMQPVHLKQDVASIRSLLPNLCSTSFACKTLIQNGAIVAFGSDAPVASPEPRLSFEAATTRYGFETQQCVTPSEWLYAHTRGAALSVGWNFYGVIREGARADFTLWDRLGGEAQALVLSSQII
ncbi:MAG: amidohydrolase [Deinococcaceae bacterium]